MQYASGDDCSINGAQPVIVFGHAVKSIVCHFWSVWFSFGFLFLDDYIWFTWQMVRYFYISVVNFRAGTKHFASISLYSSISLFPNDLCYRFLFEQSQDNCDMHMAQWRWSCFIKLQPRQSQHFTIYGRSVSTISKIHVFLFFSSHASLSCRSHRVHRTWYVNVWCDRNIMPTSFLW